MKCLSFLLLCIIAAGLLRSGSDAGHAGPGDLEAAMVAACTGDHPTLLELIRVGRVHPDAQVSGLTLLAHAASGGHLEAVKVLLRHGASVDLPSGDDRTPLMLAAGTRGGAAAGVVRALLEAGADANAVDPGGSSVLMFAVSSRRPEHVRLLLEAGADVAHRNSTGSSAIDWALGTESPAILELFEPGRRHLAAEDDPQPQE